MSGERTEPHWGAAAVDTAGWNLPALKALFLLAHVPVHGRVCEIGCGEGKLLRTLHRAQSRLELHGCDVKTPRTPPEGYSFRQIEADRLPYDNGSFDGAIVFDVLEHVRDPERTLSEAARVLKPGGQLIAFVPIEGQPLSWYAVYRRLLGGDTYVETKEHIQAFSRHRLRAMVEHEFTIEATSYAYHALGQMMDASFFAAAKLKTIRNFWWNDNAYYNGSRKGLRPAMIARVLNRLLQVGNVVAYGESWLLAGVPFSSAGILLSARVRT